MISGFSFSENTVGYLIEGDFDAEMIKNLHQRIKEKIRLYGKINLYLEDSNIEHFSLSSVLEQVLFKLEQGKFFNKVALVSDRKWIALCGKFQDIFTDANVRTFHIEDRVKAMQWIVHETD